MTTITAVTRELPHQLRSWEVSSIVRSKYIEKTSREREEKKKRQSLSGLIARIWLPDVWKFIIIMINMDRAF